jgi:hypothetical protein
MKAAKYVAQKVTANLGTGWNAIISTHSISNGAYFCEYLDTWAKLINYADFGWNYYVHFPGYF